MDEDSSKPILPRLAGYLPSGRATSQVEGKIPGLQRVRNLLLALGELKAGSQKSGEKDGAIIDLLPSHRTVAGKVSWADVFTPFGEERQNSKAQPAYLMEELAHIFGDRLQLPQRHGFSPASWENIKTGGGQGA